MRDQNLNFNTVATTLELCAFTSTTAMALGYLWADSYTSGSLLSGIPYLLNLLSWEVAASAFPMMTVNRNARAFLPEHVNIHGFSAAVSATMAVGALTGLANRLPRYFPRFSTDAAAFATLLSNFMFMFALESPLQTLTTGTTITLFNASNFGAGLLIGKAIANKIVGAHPQVEEVEEANEAVPAG